MGDCVEGGSVGGAVMVTLVSRLKPDVAAGIVVNRRTGRAVDDADTVAIAVKSAEFVVSNSTVRLRA